MSADFRPPLTWRVATVSAPYTAGDLAPSYRIDAAGNTHLRGRLNLTPGSSGTPAFVLPPMYRPKTLKRIPVATLPGGTTGRVNVNASGEVIPITSSKKVSVFFLDVTFASAGASSSGSDPVVPDDNPSAEPPDVLDDIQDVLDELEDGIEFASTRNKIYRQADQPTSTPTAPLATGDLWFDTDDANRIRVYNGSDWVDATSSYLFTPDGTLSVTPGGLYAYDANGQLTFALHAGSGDVVMRGTLNAALDISGATVTGGTVQTTDQPNRGVKMANGGLVAYDSNGSPTFVVDGSTGTVALRGDLTAGSTMTGGSAVFGNPGGARVELNASGFRAYTADGWNPLGFDTSTGQAWFNGSLSADQITSGSFSTDRLRVNSGGAVQFDTSVWVSGPLVVFGTPQQGGVYTGGLVSAGGDVSGQNLLTDGFVSAGLAVVGNSLVSRSQTGSGTVAASIDANGTLVRGGSSTLRKKTIVGDVQVDAEAVLALDPILYTLHAEEAEMDTPPVYAGFVAEQAHDLGLTPWVYYDTEGQPDGIHYNALVAAQQVVLRHQRDQLATQADQIAALSARLDALEDRAA